MRNARAAASALGVDRQPARQSRSNPVRGNPSRLRELAAWYREFAERAGSSAIWEARLHTAEDLDAEADRIERIKRIGARHGARVVQEIRSRAFAKIVLGSTLALTAVS